MISIIRNSLQDENKLKEFNDCINHAKSLTEKKRYYLGDFRHTTEEAISWWKKKASKRYDKLKSEGRIRTELEIWEPGVDLEIIR
jgi:hypothetical protein